jgi:hypothetical protein
VQDETEEKYRIFGIKGKKVKISLLQSVEAPRVETVLGSHIT